MTSVSCKCPMLSQELIKFVAELYVLTCVSEVQFITNNRNAPSNTSTLVSHNTLLHVAQYYVTLNCCVGQCISVFAMQKKRRSLVQKYVRFENIWHYMYVEKGRQHPIKHFVIKRLWTKSLDSVLFILNSYEK